MDINDMIKKCNDEIEHAEVNSEHLDYVLDYINNSDDDYDSVFSITEKLFEILINKVSDKDKFVGNILYNYEEGINFVYDKEKKLAFENWFFNKEEVVSYCIENINECSDYIKEIGIDAFNSITNNSNKKDDIIKTILDYGCSYNRIEEEEEGHFIRRIRLRSYRRRIPLNKIGIPKRLQNSDDIIDYCLNHIDQYRICLSDIGDNIFEKLYRDSSDKDKFIEFFLNSKYFPINLGNNVEVIKYCIEHSEFNHFLHLNIKEKGFEDILDTLGDKKKIY